MLRSNQRLLTPGQHHNLHVVLHNKTLLPSDYIITLGMNIRLASLQYNTTLLHLHDVHLLKISPNKKKLAKQSNIRCVKEHPVRITFTSFRRYIDRLYIALFSALEQTHCARMWFYISEQLFIARFWISTEVMYLQRWHGWCHMKLLPEWLNLGAFCVHHTTMHHVASCKATYVRCMRV